MDVTEMIKLSHSALNDFATCPRKFYFSSIERIKSVRFSEALGLGSIFHDCIAKLYETANLILAEKVIKDRAEEVRKSLGYDQRDADKLLYSETVVEAALHAWHKRFFLTDMKDGLNVVEVEKKYSNLMIRDPYNGKSKYKYRWSFISDMVAEINGELWLIEYKTAAIVNDTYFDRLAIDTQISGYIYELQKIYNRPINGVIYRVLKKPGIRLRKTDSRSQYVQRLKDLFNEKPNEYLIEIKVFRTKEELREFEIERFEKVLNISFVKQRAVYPRNTKACTVFGKCEFFALCTKQKDAEFLYESKDNG